MTLYEWKAKVYRLNVLASRMCPRSPQPCSSQREVAFYEYVTGKEGCAIVLHCLNCGALKHLEMGRVTEGEIFTPLPRGGIPAPQRDVHLPGEPGVRSCHR